MKWVLLIYFTRLHSLLSGCMDAASGMLIGVRSSRVFAVVVEVLDAPKVHSGRGMQHGIMEFPFAAKCSSSSIFRTDSLHRAEQSWLPFEGYDGLVKGIQGVRLRDSTTHWR
uniref:Putative secreted peptide n=1 Tax=Anopheles braziliensis TaxID=58242 RepID=A0A2M3ZQB5_9DIPT